VLVGELAAGGREQHIGQDEECPDHQACVARGQPVQLQLVGDHQRERELEDVVVRGTEELRPEERREAALPQEGELIGMWVLAHWRTSCGGSDRFARGSQANIESTVTVSMWLVKRRALG